MALVAAGATTGIIAGGLLTQYLGWRAVFLVNPPLIAIMLTLLRRLPARVLGLGVQPEHVGTGVA